MDMQSWKKILLQWITECNFMERNYYDIEQTDIEVFYQNFCSKHQAATTNFENLADFLNGIYPEFEIHFDDEKCLSSADYIYVYSLLLHFCCVKNPKTRFHEICQRLPDSAQQCIAEFFKEMLDTEPITKEAVRHAIAAVGNTKTTPPRLDDSFSSSVSVGGITAACFLRSDSPLKTAKHCAGPQRISPSTPKSYLLEERTRELYNLRAALETERYEKGLLEVQIKQSEEEVQKLNNDHKELLQQMQDLKNYIFIETNEGPTSSSGEEKQVQRRLLKEISQKEEEILNLSHSVQTLRDEKTLLEEKLVSAEKEIILSMNRITELELKVEELTDDVKERDEKIKHLNDSKLELEQFISETRSASVKADLNNTGDCLDNSFLRNSNNSNDSNSVGSPENLGASVVDVKLREKELENQQLKADLKYVRYEHKRLVTHLTKLTEEFYLPIDATSTGSSVGSSTETKQCFSKENSANEQINCEEQFNIFNSCVEKIYKFHKTQKNTIQQLEQLTRSLQKDNEQLIQNLNEFKNVIVELEENLSVKEKVQQDVEKSKQESELVFQKLQTDIFDIEKEKAKLYSEVKSLQVDKQKLNESIQQLKTKLELQQREFNELLSNNTKYKANEKHLFVRLQELDKEFSDKTTNLSAKLAKQFTNFEQYKYPEITIKYDNEQLAIQNTQFKKEGSLANTDLSKKKKDLNQKENHVLLGKQIADLKQKNELMGKNISTIMTEHKKELHTSSCTQTELNAHIRKLKESFTKMELLMESEQYECELKQRQLDKIRAEIIKIFQLVTNSEDAKEGDLLSIIFDLKIHIESVMVTKNDLDITCHSLQGSLKDSLSKAENLSQELNEKCVELEKFQACSLASEMKIAELRQQQLCILEKSKSDMNEKEQELKDRLKKASLGYDTSLKCIASELKTEKKNNANNEMELILIKADVNAAKNKLSEAVREIENLCNGKQQMQRSCERLKQFETRVTELSEENNKMRNEIETFKQQVTQNALRILEADKALAEYVERIKEQESAKDAVEVLQNKLKEKEEYLLEIDFKLQQQSLFEEQIQLLKQQLDKQIDIKKEELDEDKTRLSKEVEEKNHQILNDQQEKLMLLNSLEKSSDELKSVVEETLHQKDHLELKIRQLTDQLDTLNYQNTKLKGDLIEREAELRLALEEQEQEKNLFEQKLTQQMEDLTKIADQLENTDTVLMEIVTIIEEHFNINQDFKQRDDNNVFNYQETQSTNQLQKLRKHLNNILLKEQDLNEKIKQITSQKEEAVLSLVTLQDCNNDLVAKLNQHEVTLRETQEELQNKLIGERKALQKVKCLEDDLLNLEKVNDHLTNENAKIQANLDTVKQELQGSKNKILLLEDESLHIREDNRRKTLIIEDLQQELNKLHITMEEKSLQIGKQLEKCKSLESQLENKTTKLQAFEKECQEIKEKANKYQQTLTHHQQTQQAGDKKLQEKLMLLQASNDSLEADLIKKHKENSTMENMNTNLLQRYKNQELQLQLTSQKLDEMVTNKLNAEAKNEQLQSEIHQLKADFELTKVHHQAQQEENVRLNQEIESLKEDKKHLRDEIHENKLSLQRDNENISQLIQQISSIRLEKETALEESVLLSKQLEETSKSQTSSASKMKSLIEKSQGLERQLLAVENELKTVKVNLGNCESSSEKLKFENKKLRDNQEVTTKRIEKLALKLGDSQARSAKLERDNEKLGRILESHVASVEALQREKFLLQSDAKSLKERLSRAERGHEQLVAKAKNLEHLNTSLQQIKQKLEASEIDYKAKLNKLEKMRELNEEKIRKLTHSLNNIENSNVKLNLEIGALNCQLQATKIENYREQVQKLKELNNELTEAQKLQHKYQDLNEKLKIELNTLKEENASLNDKLSKASLSLQITSKKCECIAAEMEQMRAEMLIIRQEKTQIEQQHETFVEKIKQFESQNAKIVCENDNLITLEQKIADLEEELAAKSKEVVDLVKEIENLKVSEFRNSVTLQTSIANLTELEHLRTKISQAEDLHLKDQQIISQLRLDNQILHTKYQESKQRVLDATKTSEERIKENRLELEGKLEKMKNKMKTLYTEEIAKMKTKEDGEMAIIKSEMEVLKNQNFKYEEHTRKLSNQIVRLNDNILQYQKENTILSTKLRHLTDQLQEVERNKRPASIHVSSMSLPTASVAGSNMGRNLAMEDEEGEVFNTTYLTDLKNGRMTELMSRDVCVEELKYRNSMLPPHLRSSYAAQVDHEFHDGLKQDDHNNLDDSMSALLSTTTGGTRRKCSGVTHYKRPGPPTPSKNGGRLSFGGSSEPAREVLKESYDANAGIAMSSSKTPARFNFFTSRFSMGTNKEEKPCNKIKIRNVTASWRHLACVGCTSTPRKGKEHFEQRRLINHPLSSPSPLTIDNKFIIQDVAAVFRRETSGTALEMADISKSPTHKTIAKRLEAITGGLKRCRRNSSFFGRRLSRNIQEICTPTSGETSSSALSTPVVAKTKSMTQFIVSDSATDSGGVNMTTVLKRQFRKKPKKEKGSRPSIYMRGNIFASYRTSNKGTVFDLYRQKSRKQRMEHFNKCRNIKFVKLYGKNVKMGKTVNSNTGSNVSFNWKNNNYSTCNHNKFVGETAVTGKYALNKREWIEDTCTFGEEQFEHPTESVNNLEHNDIEIDNNEQVRGGKNTFAKHDLLYKQELVTSQDLEDFDRFITNYKVKTCNKKPKGKVPAFGSSQNFEKILVETNSNAPFDVKDIQLNTIKDSSSNSQRSSLSTHSTQSSQFQIDSENDCFYTTLTTATPHLSPISTTCHLSRTIYSGTVMYNHRLPNINTTYVRKSSIYVKNRKKISQHPFDSSSNDVVLITNQTITFTDIMRMWSQMDCTTRIIVSFAVLASLTTILGLLISLCSRR